MLKGEWFESYLQDTCDLIDNHGQWIGTRLECQRNVRLSGVRQNHEYDYIIKFQIGPAQLGLEPIIFVFSAKSGMIGVEQIMEFYHALSDTIEFRAVQGDFKRNIVPIVVINKTMSGRAWQLCGQLGIRVIKEIDMREIWKALTKEELFFKEYCERKRVQNEGTKIELS